MNATCASVNSQPPFKPFMEILIFGFAIAFAIYLAFKL